MKVSDLYTMCDNLPVDAMFHIYKDYDDYKHDKEPIWFGIYDDMTSDFYNSKVRLFHIANDGDDIEVLID